MIRNYIVIAIRNILRHKFFSLINVIGLSVSLFVCLLVFKMIFAMYSSDRFHENRKRIYRVITTTQNPPYDAMQLATSPYTLKDELQKLNDVEHIVRLWNRFQDDALTDSSSLPAKGFFADPEFFKVFSYNLTSGDPENVLLDPYSVVITQDWAEKFFRNKNPIGSFISFNTFGDYKVTGIVESIKNKKSHMEFDLIASSNSLWSNLSDASSEKQSDSPYQFIQTKNPWKDVYRAYTFILFKEKFNLTSVDDQLKNIINHHYGSFETKYSFDLQPLLKISPGKNLANALGRIETPLGTYVFSFIAIIITITASFTYTNLSIAKMLSRAREVGIRKVIGANRVQLITQFLTETIILTLIALNFAYILLFLLEPGFFSIDPYLKESFYIENQPIGIYITTILFTLLLGSLIGFFPSLVYSRMRPVFIMKDIVQANISPKMTLKKVIIIFQFSISLILVFVITIMYQQVKYQQQIDLGFNPENILTINLKNNDFDKAHQVLNQIAYVEDVAAIDFLPSIGIKSVVWARIPDHDDSLKSSQLIVSPNLMETLEIDMIAGKGFSGMPIPEKEKYVIINPTAVKAFGYESPYDAVGNLLIIDGDHLLTIIGVTSEIVLQSVEFEPTPLIYRMNKKHFQKVLVKYNPGSNIENLVSSVGIAWDKIDPIHEFTYQFYTSEIDAYYTSPNGILKVLTSIAAFAILISFMGLLGMVLYNTESRIKEIGIRKVFGARINQVAWVISKGFLMMILLAVIITIPLTWIGAELILQNFYNRIDVNITLFLFGIILMLSIGLITILSQTLVAARRNPVDTLRYE